MKTKDKIVDASLELFNQFGERSVTTNHIAKHLSMSPGNLYYHFRNKEDIILSIVARYIEFITSTISSPSDDTPAEAFLESYCSQVFESLWHFRFFHASMPAILQRDERLHEHYLIAHHLLERRATSALNRLKAEQLIDIDEADIEGLVELMRLVTGFWVSYSMANSLNEDITKTKVYEGVVKLILLISAYSTAEGKLVFNGLRERYLNLSHT